MDLHRRAMVRLVVLGGIWGTSFLFIKVALEGLTPSQIVLGRLIAGVAVMAAVVVARREPLPRDGRLWGHAAVMSVVANVVPFTLFAIGEQQVTSGMAGVLNATTPLFTLAIVMAALPGERPTRNRVLGLLIGFVGAVVTVGPWRDQGENRVAGQLACLAAAACYGVAFTYTRRFMTGRGIPPMVLSMMQLSCGLVGAAVVAPLAGWETPRLTTPVLLSVLALGALGTGIAYLMYYRLVEEAGATTASMTTYIIPVVAVLLGVVVLGEPVSWNLFAGAAVVILGVAMAEGRLGLRSPRSATGRTAAAAGERDLPSSTATGGGSGRR